MSARSESTGRKIFAESPVLRAYSVAEFCRAYSISVPLYYKLDAKGEAPVSFHLGTRRLISVEAAERWCREREQAARETA